MKERIKDRKIVVVNQAVNHLTIGICNALAARFEHVDLITGSVHEQGESLNNRIRITRINKWAERPASKKLYSYIMGTLAIYWLLLIKYRRYEVFFVSIPPTAYLLKVALPNRFSMLIWDVYPDIFKITGMKESHLLYRFWARLNRIVFKKAFRLFTIGNRMAHLLETYIARDKLLITPLWSIFQANEKVPKEKNPFVLQENLLGKFVVQYSGNIGLTHKVEVMVELAARMRNYPDILFQIIGRGPRVLSLKKTVEEKNLENCQFLPFQSDDMFPYSLSAADLGVVILDDLTSKGSVPSKSYNLMSYGIPSLYIAASDSELYDYSLKYRNAKCFDEQHLDEAVAFILELSRDKALYADYVQNSLSAADDYKRSNADQIVELYLK
jgi:hypothetical protein